MWFATFIRDLLDYLKPVIQVIKTGVVSDVIHKNNNLGNKYMQNIDETQTQWKIKETLNIGVGSRGRGGGAVVPLDFLFD